MKVNPYSDEYRELEGRVAATFKSAPTEAEALAALEAAEQRLRAEARQLAARRVVGKIAGVKQRAQAAADRERAREAERQLVEKEAAEAWRSLFGRERARELRPWASYTVIELEGSCFAIEGAVPAVGETVVAAGVSGVSLGTVTDRLDGVNPERSKLIEVRRAAAGRLRAARERERAALAEEDRRENERRRYGVALSEAERE